MSTQGHGQQLSAEAVRELVVQYYNRLLSRRSLAIISIPIAILLVGLTLAIAFESTFYLSPVIKSLALGGLVGLSIITGIYLVKQFRPDSFNEYYRKFSAQYEVHEIRHTLDLFENPRNDHSTLREAALKQNLSRLKQDVIAEKLREFNRHHPLHHLHLTGRFAIGGGLLLFLIPLLFAPESTQRYAQFWSEFEQPIPYEFTVEPGNTTLEQGSEFRAQIRFEGNIPEDLNIAMRTDVESDYRRRGLDETEEGVFAAPVIELFDDLSYYIEMDGYDSEHYRAEVQHLPRFRDLQVEVHAPAYTGLEPESYTYPFSRIEAFPGSRAEIEGQPNKTLEQAQYLSSVRGDSIELHLSDEDDSIYTATLDVNEADTAAFHLKDEYGLQNRNRFEFEIALREDQAPTAEILHPEREKQLISPGPVDLVYEITDDFGFSAVTLHYELRKAYVDEPITGSAQLDVPAGDEAIDDKVWDLETLQMGSMDELTYWIEVSDNNTVTGPQTGQSAPHVITIQSLAEQLTDQRDREDDVERSLDDIQTQYGEFRETIEQLRREIQENPEGDWEQSQILDDMKEQRQDLDEQVEELQRDFDELTEQLEQSGTLSEDTQQLYNELQDLMNEIDDPDLMRMIEEFQENLRNMDQTQMREMLDEFEFNEDRYRDRLERTVDLFKQLRLNADLDSMSRLFDELGMQEQEILDSDELGDEEIRQQENIREEMDELHERLDQMADDPPERHRRMMEEIQESYGQEMDHLKQQLEENIEGMQGGDPDEEQLRDQQQDIRDQMQQMSEAFAETRESMQQEQLNVNIATLKSILGGLVHLSVAQENLTKETVQLTDNSPAFVDHARRQRNIGRQFQQFTDSLRQVASEVPQFPNQVSDRQRETQRYIERATDYLIDRDVSQAGAAERNALGEMNRLSSLLADLIDQLEDQAGDGAGDGMTAEQMMEQMQQMSQDQQELNQQVQDFINDLQGDRLSQDELERLEQIAEQQNRIREQLRELQRRGGFRSGDETLSELERINEEMEETIRDLRGGQTDDIMVQRQQNILSRMLETEESMQQQDEDEEERRGETAEDYERGDTAEFTADELRQYMRRSLQEADQTRFSEDYQRLIEAYFRLLESKVGDDELPEEN